MLSGFAKLKKRFAFFCIKRNEKNKLGVDSNQCSFDGINIGLR
jgi:hypothetical protein